MGPFLTRSTIVQTLHRTAALATGLVLVLAACASDVGDDDAMEGMDMGESDMDGMDMGDMVMNEPDAPRADELEGVELRTADFVRFADLPEEFLQATGTAYVAFDDETTVTLDLAGLPAGVEIIAHLHAQPCAARGGPHFMFDLAGPAAPPNEVHLAGTPEEDGTLTLNVTNDRAAYDAMAVVFHPRADTDTYVACADVPPLS